MPNSRELSAIISSVAATTSHLMTTVATGITHPTTQLPHTSISNIIVTKNKCNDKSCSSNNNSNSKSNSSGIDNNDVVNSGNNDKKSNNTNNSNNNNINDNKLNATTLNIPATIEEHQQEQQQLTQQQLKLLRQSTSSDDDSAMQSFERRDSSSSGFYTRSGCSATMESEYSAMVASVYQNEMANSDSASVASDLTRMYVSDEDEKPEFQVTHFH
ncbi:putative uncharacterized protein DDB_G0287457 [Teleopsis dalmanni]|nr:putative uncharacterized protein DDB_G0287457 [Teleopsis dalmanni]